MKLLILSLVMISGCATLKPPVQKEIVKSSVVQGDYDKTWASVVRYFAENNITIKNIEKASGLIATDSKTFDPFNNGGAIDCGSLSGVTAATITGIAIYNVFVEKVDAKSTRVTINLKSNMTSAVKSSYYTESAGSRECYSTGKFESEMLGKLK